MCKPLSSNELGSIMPLLWREDGSVWRRNLPWPFTVLENSFFELRNISAAYALTHICTRLIVPSRS
jgi:hypothetical protein